jgi:hypothetical protein
MATHTLVFGANDFASQVASYGGNQEGAWKGGPPCGSNMVEVLPVRRLLVPLLPEQIKGHHQKPGSGEPKP